MKKTLSLILLSALIAATFALTVHAAPMAPEILAPLPDVSRYTLSDAATLYTDIAPVDGAATLVIQWYSTTVNDISTIRAIVGANGETYQPPKTEGVVYYCYGAWNECGSERSQIVYSRLAKVEYRELGETPLSLAIAEVPDKTEYKSGEYLDPTGLKVRIFTDNGFIDSTNGAWLELTTKPLVTKGEQKIRVGVGDVMDVFLVLVKEGDHVHYFEEPSVTKPATCTEDGEETRACSCGEKITSVLPAAGHQWTLRGQADGTKIAVCSVCGEKGDVSSVGTDLPAATDATDGTSVSATHTDTQQGAKLIEEHPPIPLGALLIIGAALIIVGCTLGVVITLIVVSRRRKR